MQRTARKKDTFWSDSSYKTYLSHLIFSFKLVKLFFDLGVLRKYPKSLKKKNVIDRFSGESQVINRIGSSFMTSFFASFFIQF